VTDVFFRLGDVKLYPAGTLAGTANFSRGGWSFVQQTISELFVEQGELVWIRRERTARGTSSDQPLTAHCRVSRNAYRVIRGRFAPTRHVDSNDLEKRQLQPLARHEAKEILPCCAGCSIRN
jgi:hypothetical protein